MLEVGRLTGSVGGLSPALPEALLREHARRVASFSVAGVLGAVTTLGGTAILYHHVIFLPLWLASAVAIQTAIIVTFLVNSRVTWRDRQGGRRLRRALTFEAVSLVGMGIQEAALLTGTDALHIFYLLALLVGIGLAAIWNYLVNNLVTFAAA